EPGPRGEILRQITSGEAPFDDGRIDDSLSGRPARLADPRRTAAADHADRVHPVRAEAERPGKPCRRDLPEDLAVRGAVLHFHVVSVANSTLEFGRAAIEVNA